MWDVITRIGRALGTWILSQWRTRIGLRVDLDTDREIFADVGMILTDRAVDEHILSNH